MARHPKNNADYFSHDNNMRNDDKIKAVRRRFGHVGYSIWNMVLEKLCSSEGFVLSCKEINMEIMAGDFEVETDTLENLIEYFLRLELLTKHDGLIFSENMIKRFSGLVEKRKKDKERAERRRRGESGFFVSETPSEDNCRSDNTKRTDIVAMSEPQSKVKESKVKESKGKNIFKPPTLEDVQIFFSERGFSESLAKKAFEYYELANWKDSKGQKVKNWKQKMLAVWLKEDNKEKEKSSGKKEKEKPGKIEQVFTERDKAHELLKQNWD